MLLWALYETYDEQDHSAIGYPTIHLLSYM